MIELRHDTLVFSFPELHPDARLEIDFQRTLRIPDDGSDYPLPPGLGRFPLRHVDDFAARVPESWRRHGGVMLPMYQAEALWLSFRSPSGYPFAAKVATGKIDAVSGEAWRDGLHREPQDYLPVPGQPWLDGYCVDKGFIRQFVAMPLGSGYSAEEQLTGSAEHGGLQLALLPMKAAEWKRILEARRPGPGTRGLHAAMAPACAAAPASLEMGLAPGGRMRQSIYRDPYPREAWETRTSSRCFVHIANSLTWRALTGSPAPTVPPTAAEYQRAGLPWFEYYSERAAVDGAGPLRRLKSILRLGAEKGDVPLPENETVVPEKVHYIIQRDDPERVREGVF